LRTREADFLLSIVARAAAYQVAERFSEPLGRANPKPVFVECNAIALPTMRRIEQLLAASGCAFVDARIAGGPPLPRSHYAAKGPRFYGSGEHANLFAALAPYGFDIDA